MLQREEMGITLDQKNSLEKFYFCSVSKHPFNSTLELLICEAFAMAYAQTKSTRIHQSVVDQAKQFLALLPNKSEMSSQSLSDSQKTSDYA